MDSASPASHPRRRLVVDRLRREHTVIERNESAQPPPIEITIGRIDVRAVTGNAPVPPPRTKAMPQVLSLDDYLATREGGGG